MRENGIGRRVRKRYRSTTDSNHGLKVVEDLLKRQFDVAKSNQAWVSDITYILHEPLEGSSVFLVGTGESRTLPETKILYCL